MLLKRALLFTFIAATATAWPFRAEAQSVREQKFTTRDVKIYYKAEDKSGIKDRKLWVTTDEGTLWQPAQRADWGQDTATQTYFIFHAAADGRYGFFLQFSDLAGNSTPPPQAGQKPKLIIVIDTQQVASRPVPMLDPGEEKFTTMMITKRYTTSNKGAIKERKLWMTANEGTDWKMAENVEWSEDPAGQMFFRLQVPANGRYGLALQFADLKGPTMPAPMAGEKPSTVAVVESVGSLVAPVIIDPHPGAQWVTGKISLIEWATPGEGWKSKSAALYFSIDNGPWTLITKGLELTRYYGWAPMKETQNLRLRVSVMRTDGQEVLSEPAGPVVVKSMTKPDIAAAKKHFQKAGLLAAQRLWEEAAMEYQKAIELWPDYTDAMNELGATFYEAGKYDKALEFFLRAKDISGSNSAAFVNVGFAYLKLGLADDAVPMFQDAIEIGVSEKSVVVPLSDVLWRLAERREQEKNLAGARRAAEMILKLETAPKSIRKKAQDWISSHKSS